MRLSNRTIADLAEQICGAHGGGSFEWENFPYRTSSQLTRFFRNCDLSEYRHPGSTRHLWVEEVLVELNKGPVTVPGLPPDPIVRVLQELTDPTEFESSQLDREQALEDLNSTLARDGLEVYLDPEKRCHVRHVDRQTTSATMKMHSRRLSNVEMKRRKQLERFLDTALEDELIEQFLIPMFRQLGFRRVTPIGHRDRSLEFGKDIWMKYPLPTGHSIYFSAQVKRDKIDAAGRDLSKNISGILAQIEMILDYPVFDPETNRKHLVDHVYVISAKAITKQARALLGEHLDREARRHIIFMDREELLDLGAMTGLNPQCDAANDEVPF